MTALRAIVRTIDALNLTIGRVTALSLLVLIALVVWEVVLRYGFNAPTTWGYELISYIFAGYIMLGGGYTLLHRDHVSMDIFYARLSPRAQSTLDVFTAAFVIIYCVVLLRETTVMTMDAFRTGQRASSDWSPPLFPVYLFFAIGAVLILLQAISKLMRDLYMMIVGHELLPDLAAEEHTEVSL